ncbi:MAG: MlaD family protein [Bacteroidota bacterium]
MSKEFKIGILTVVAGGLLYYGFNFLRGMDLFSPSDRYYVIYPNVSGLNVSNPVYFNGLPIGRVSGFELQQSRSRIVVSLDIERNVFVGDDATATLANDGLLGGKAILLNTGKSLEKLKAGDTLNSEIDGSLLDQFKPVTDNLNTTITKINTLLDQLNSTDLKGVIDTLKYSIGTMTYKVEKLDIESVVGNINELMVSFKQRSDQMGGLLDESTILMDSLNSLEMGKLVTQLSESMNKVNSIMAGIQSGEGTVGQLMTNDSVYNNLNKLLISLDDLTNHFNNYPKDFLKPLGRKNKQQKGGKEEKK